MAEDLREKYCCDSCKDDFHNEQKREKSTELKNSDSEISEKNDVPILAPRKNEPAVLLRNIEILENLFSVNEDEVYVSFEELDCKGVDLSVNNGQGDLYNTPNESNCKFLIIGPYHLFRVSFDTALIVNSKSL